MKIFIISLLSLYSLASDVVRNGAGLAEQNLWFSLGKLDSFIDICLGSDSCVSSVRHRSLLLLIKSSLDEERENKQILSFKSERKNPGFFIIDGLERVAHTGQNVADTIYINTDLLYVKRGGIPKSPFSISQSIQLLIHEFAHHHGEYNHDELDLLGAKVRLFFSKQVDHVYHNPYLYNLSALSIYHQSFKHNGSLLLYTGEEYYDLRPAFKKEARCSKKLLSSLNPLIRETKQFYNISWNHNLGRRVSGKKQLRGLLVLLCDYKLQGDLYEYYEFEIDLEVRTSNFKNFVLKSNPRLAKLKKLYTVDDNGLFKR